MRTNKPASKKKCCQGRVGFRNKEVREIFCEKVSDIKEIFIMELEVAITDTEVRVKGYFRKQRHRLL